MKELDKLLRKERIKKYKYYRKLFQARDAARKYVKRKMYVKHIECTIHNEFLKCADAVSIAKRLIDLEGKLRSSRPPVPPLQVRPKPVSQRPKGTIDK